VSIIYRDFVWTITGFDWKRYRGKRAVFISLACLFFISFILVPSLDARYDWFNYTTFAYSFVAGIPVAWILHRILVWFVSKSGLSSVVLNSHSKQPITMTRFLSWLIVGIPAGSLFGYFVYIASSYYILSIILGVMCVGIITWLFSRADWM